MFLLDWGYILDLMSAVIDTQWKYLPRIINRTSKGTYPLYDAFRAAGGPEHQQEIGTLVDSLTPIITNEKMYLNDRMVQVYVSLGVDYFVDNVACLAELFIKTKDALVRKEPII